ncbi:MAG: peptidase [Gammaproteobacteria bacterium]|nr:MAG: peptidase [Gammaproteobacteria bacterium]
MNNTKNLLSAIVISVSLAIGGCTSHDINAGVGIAANLFKGATITNEQLAAQARLSARAMDRKIPVAPPGSRYARRLNRLTRNLRHYDGLNLNYKVYLSKKINAFAMPDGSVRVYSGLMDIMNDDELLSVIGHEIGHVKHRHSLNQYRKIYLAKAATMGVAAYGGSTVGALAGSYGNIGLAFVQAQFSQHDELEADTYGVHLLKRIGRNPYAAAAAQRKLMAKAGANRGGLFSSHPPTTERIKKTTQIADRLTGK